MKTASWMAGLALGGLVLTTFGCDDSLEPGDYVVYRVSTTTTELSEGCYANKSVPADLAHDSSTFRESQTIMLYAATEGLYYLDSGASTLEGGMEETGDGELYTFKGKSVDVTYAGANGTGDKLTATASTTIKMTVVDQVVTGTAKTKTTISCKGATCGASIPSCTTSTTFVGTEVEDVELDHAVDGDGSGVQPPPQAGVPTSGSGGGTGTGTGEGGSGGDDPGGDCSTCSDALASGPSEVWCAGSDELYVEVFSCACSGACNDACYDTCANGASPSGDCQNCAYDVCYAETNACVSDG